MRFKSIIQKSTIPDDLKLQAIQSLKDCRIKSKGSIWKKWKVRLFKHKWIAKQLKWETNRLIEIRPDLLDMDIEPVTKVSCNGDNGEWNGNPGFPIEDSWMNQDPISEDYLKAVKSCYWSKGNHPRSTKAREAWYLRNAGAGYVYRIGCPVDETEGLKIYRVKDGRTEAVIFKSGNAWQMHIHVKLFGKLSWFRRIGYEVDNVYSGTIAPQAWFAIPGYILKAPVSWGGIGTLTTKEVYERKDHWEGVEQTKNGDVDV